MSNGSTALARIEKQTEIATRVDEIAAGAMAIFQAPNSFAAELQLARAIGDLRMTLAPEVMEPVMALQNTKLGFLTDQKGGYPAEVVRDVLIEAKLRGYHAIGNEFNIIKGGFYAAKNGVRRKVLELVTDLKESYGVPKSSNGGAVVACKATWKRTGVGDALDAEIPVRVNDQMGADAILGKAERKFLARILARVSGVITPDGDVEDQGAAGGDVIDVTPEKPTAPPPSSPPPRDRTTRAAAPPPANDVVPAGAGPDGAPSPSAPPGATPAVAKGREPGEDDADELDRVFGPEPPAVTAAKDKAEKDMHDEVHAIEEALRPVTTWAALEPLGQRARALPTAYQDLVLDRYIATVLRVMASVATPTDYDKVVSEFGRLRKVCTPAQWEQGKATMTAAQARLRGGK
jgi:hypothetical protein